MSHHALYILTECGLTLPFQVSKGNDKKRSDDRRGYVQHEGNEELMLPKEIERNNHREDIRTELERMNLMVQNFVTAIHVLHLVPDLQPDLARLYLDQIAHLSERIKALEERMADEAEKSAVAARLRRVPGIGPVTAMAIETFAPTMANFRRGRTSPLGSDSCRASTPPAANRD